jgi:hypothetical protein
MTQRQLDILRPVYEANVIPIGPRHLVEVRKKGTAIGIYTLSLPNNKKRGVSLPLDVWRVLQEQLCLINLNIEFASGTVGIDVLDGVDPAYICGYTTDYKQG